MATDIERLVVQLEANMRNFERKMDRAVQKADGTSTRMERRFQRAGRKIEGAFSVMSRGAVTALGSIGVAVSGVAFANLVRESLAAAEAIEDMSRRAGVSAEFLQEMRFAASQNGAEVRDWDDAISRLNRRLGLFQEHLRTGTGEAGPAANALRSLGLEARIASGELRDAEDVFGAAVRALEGIDDQSRRAALASQLFGEDSGPRLAQLLSLGTAGIEEQRQAARDLGVVMDEELRAKAAAASDALERMQMVIDTANMEAISDHADGLIELSEAYARVAQWAIRAAAFAGEFIGTVDDWDAAARPAEEARRNNRIAATSVQAQIDRTRRLIDNPATYDFRRAELERELVDLEANLAVLDGQYDRMIARWQQEEARRRSSPDSHEQETPPSELSAKPAKVSERRVIATGLEDKEDLERAQQEQAELAVSISEELNDKMREASAAFAEEFKENRETFARTFGDAMADGGLALAEGRFPEFLANRLRQALYSRLFDVFSRLGEILFDRMSAGSGKPGGGQWTQAFTAAFAGGKASGGLAYGGRMYRVGEHGPEDIVMPHSGVVLPNVAQTPLQGGRVIERERVVVVSVDKSEMFETAVKEQAQPIAAGEARKAATHSRQQMAKQGRKRQMSF